MQTEKMKALLEASKGLLQMEGKSTGEIVAARQALEKAVTEAAQTPDAPEAPPAPPAAPAADIRPSKSKTPAGATKVDNKAAEDIKAQPAPAYDYQTERTKLNEIFGKEHMDSMQRSIVGIGETNGR